MMKERNPDPKWLGGIVAGFFVVVFFLGFMTGETRAYRIAKQQNTIDGWDSYLKRYPQGGHWQEAERLSDALLMKQVEANARNPTELEALFKRCKGAETVARVNKMWEAALWEETKRAGTEEAYRKYQFHFHGSQNENEARNKLEELVWRRARESKKAEIYQEYLKEYPGGLHAAEARSALGDFAYEEVRMKDTVEAYEAFLQQHYEHKEAARRLRELRYQRAVDLGTLEAWTAFDQAYHYLFEEGDGSEVAQMNANAAKELERLLYEKINAHPTLESCRDYLLRYENGAHSPQVLVKMEPCLFEEAVRVNQFQLYFEYLRKYPVGYRDQEIRTRLEALLFGPLAGKETLYSFNEYLELVPDSSDALRARMEPLMFEWVKRVHDLESCELYLDHYPSGNHLPEVQEVLDPILFKKAQEEDWYSVYEEYLRRCPNGKNVGKANERLAFLKANKAEIEVKFPEVLEQGPSPYSNVSSPYWGWSTVFKEKSGKCGFRVYGSGHIEDNQEKMWGSLGGGGISRKEVKVPAGGTGQDEYWCSSGDHHFCNGYAIFKWTGEDAGGHPITIDEKVILKHTDCPGPRKDPVIP